MLSTRSCNNCYLLTNLYIFFFWDIAQLYHEKFYILITVIVVANVFQLYLATGLSFESNIFHGPF